MLRRLFVGRLRGLREGCTSRFKLNSLREYRISVSIGHDGEVGGTGCGRSVLTVHQTLWFRLRATVVMTS